MATKKTTKDLPAGNKSTTIKGGKPQEQNDK
jgi:hypothetical protein